MKGRFFREKDGIFEEGALAITMLPLFCFSFRFYIWESRGIDNICALYSTCINFNYYFTLTARFKKKNATLKLHKYSKVFLITSLFCCLKYVYSS